MNTAKTIGIIAACFAAGYLAADAGKQQPAVAVTPVSVGQPPDSTLGLVKCLCSGDCECSPVCLCKEPDECNPPKAAACTQCGGDGLLSTDYGEILCPTCNKGKSSQLPTFTPAPLYTQPQPAKAVTVQSYSSCANGQCSVGGSRGGFRLFRRRR